jgi:hypothetical protein
MQSESKVEVNSFPVVNIMRAREALGQVNSRLEHTLARLVDEQLVDYDQRWEDGAESIRREYQRSIKRAPLADPSLEISTAKESLASRVKDILYSLNEGPIAQHLAEAERVGDNTVADLWGDWVKDGCAYAGFLTRQLSDVAGDQ